MKLSPSETAWLLCVLWAGVSYVACGALEMRRASWPSRTALDRSFIRVSVVVAAVATAAFAAVWIAALGR